MKLATRYDCSHRRLPGSGLQHDHGNGSPPRARCRGCGGRLEAERGLHGVFAWDKSNRYPFGAAERTYVSAGQAAGRAELLNANPDGTLGGWVTRWIPERQIPAAVRFA